MKNPSEFEPKYPMLAIHQVTTTCNGGSDKYMYSKLIIKPLVLDFSHQPRTKKRFFPFETENLRKKIE